MTRIRISELNDLNDLEQGDEIPVVREGATGKATYTPPADERLVPEGGSEGQVVKKTATGVEWGDDEVGTPGSGEANVNADWNATSGDAEILNKPDIPSGDRLVPTGGSAGQVVKKTATGVEWGTDEVGQAGSGEQNVQADWDENDTQSDAYIQNKPQLAPSDAEANVNADWSATSGDAEILNKPDIPAGDRLVPTGGSTGQVVKKTATGIEWGDDEVGSPGSGEENVNADWDATSGDAEILNKPDIPTVASINTQIDDKVPATFQTNNTDEIAAAKIPLATDAQRGGISHAFFSRLSGLNNAGVMAKAHVAGVRLRTGSSENLTPDSQKRIYGTTTNFASGAWWRDNDILHGWIQVEGADLGGNLPASQNYIMLTVKDATNDIHQFAFPDADDHHYERRWIFSANPGNWKKTTNVLTGGGAPSTSIGTTGSLYIRTDGAVPSTYIRDGSNTWHEFHTFTQAERTKLQNIQAQAEVNVQSDWNVTDTNSKAFIKNKPDLSSLSGGDATYQGVWSSSTTYSEGDIVRTGAVRYWILAGGADSTNEQPGAEASRWLALNNYYGAWDGDDAPYAVGQIVLQGGDIYINTWSNNSDTPGGSGTNSARWINLSDGENNVQADWNQTSSTNDAFIKNKPEVIGGSYVEDEFRLINTAALEDGGVIWSGTYKEATISGGTQSDPIRGMRRSEFGSSTGGSTDSTTTNVPISKLTGRQSDADSFISAFYWHDDEIFLAFGNDGGTGLATHFYSDLRVAMVINGNKGWDVAMSDATTSTEGGGDTRFAWNQGSDPFPSESGREFRLLFYRHSTSRGLKYLYNHTDLTGEEIRDELGGLSGDNRMSVNALKDYVPGDLTANNRETLLDNTITTGNAPGVGSQDTIADLGTTFQLSRVLSETDDKKLMVFAIRLGNNATDRNGTWHTATVYAGQFRTAANASTGSINSLPNNGFALALGGGNNADAWERAVLAKLSDRTFGVADVSNQVYVTGMKVYLQPIVGSGLGGSGSGLDAQEQADFDALSTGLFKVNKTRRATFNLTAATSGTKTGWGDADSGSYGAVDQHNLDGERVSTNSTLNNIDITVKEISTNGSFLQFKVGTAAHASALEGHWVTGLRLFVINATTGAKVLDSSPVSFQGLTTGSDTFSLSVQANENFVAGSKYIVGFYKSSDGTDVDTAAQILANGYYDLGVRSKGIISFYKRGSSSSSAPSGKPTLPSIGIPPHVFFGLNGWQIPVIPGYNQGTSQVNDVNERWYSLAALPVSDGYLWKMSSPYEIDSVTGDVRLTGTKWLRERLTHAAHVDH